VCWCDTKSIVIKTAENITVVLVSPSGIFLFFLKANVLFTRAHMPP
jgi:hypothetical protein